MKATIYCEPTSKGVHSFFLITAEEKYFLFSQDYRQGVHDYYKKGVLLEEATNFSKSHRDNAIRRTMTKIPMYIKYIEKEYGVEILEQTKKRNRYNSRYCGTLCA